MENGKFSHQLSGDQLLRGGVYCISTGICGFPCGFPGFLMQFLGFLMGFGTQRPTNSIKSAV